MEKSSKCATDKEFIVIGRIGKPHGVKGSIRVYPLTDFPGRFTDLRSAYIDSTPVEIISAQYSNDFIIMNIKTFDTREKAASVTGRLLKIDRRDAAPLSEGEYYAFDIIGLDVYDENGIQVGTVVNILKTGSNDVYVIAVPGQKDYLLPALKKYVKEINLAEKRIVVELPEWVEAE